jgi:hypothetical protein
MKGALKAKKENKCGDFFSWFGWVLQVLYFLAPPRGLEPLTYGLGIRSNSIFLCFLLLSIVVLSYIYQGVILGRSFTKFSQD